MAASQEFSLPIDDIAKIDSKELEKILQNFAFDGDGGGTASDLSRLLEAAAADTDTAGTSQQLGTMTSGGVAQPTSQATLSQNTAVAPGQGRGGKPRGGPPRQAGSRGRGGNSSVMAGNLPQHQAAPYVEIIEQPRSKGLRFRYQCEGRSAGSIPGEHSTAEKKTYPTIKIHNHTGSAVVVVSCVTKDQPKPKPHPHALVGKDCTKGVCTVRVKDTSVIKFPHLGIQCAKKKDVENHIRERKEINVDPFQTGFDHVKEIDLNIVRLCFQVFLPDKQGKFSRIVPPVCSNAILDKKAHNELVICRIDHTSGRARGGDEVFLLCEKVNKDDIHVRFYEENPDGTVEWEDHADFGQGDVHRQLAIVFRTPAYKEPNIRSPKHVFLQLSRPSDSEVSESIQFTYMPEDPDPHHIEEKRKRKCQQFDSFIQDDIPVAGRNALVKERIKAKASRKIKQEQVDPGLPAYSIRNIEGQASNSLCAGGSGYMPGTSGLTAGGPIDYIPATQTTAASATVGQQLSAAATMGTVVMANPNPYQLAEGAQVVPQDEINDLQMTSIPEGQDLIRMNSEFVFQTSAMTYQSTDPMISDINFSGTANSFDLSVLQDYLRDTPPGMNEGEPTEVASYGLSGDMLTTDYDPGVGAMVSVSSDTMENDPETQRQCEEVHKALSNLN